MSTPSIIIEPLKVDDLDAFVTIQHAAFEPLEADMIFPMVYPAGLQPDLSQRLRHRLLAMTNNRPELSCFGAKDAATGEVVGVAWWQVILEPPQTREEVDASFARAVQARSAFPPVQGMNVELDDAFYRAAFYALQDLAAGKPHVELRLLATHPRHHRRGVGSLLLQEGLRKADALRLPVTLSSSRSGKALYERFGFEVVKEMPFDAREYGGRSHGRHWCMIRPANKEA